MFIEHMYEYTSHLKIAVFASHPTLCVAEAQNRLMLWLHQRSPGLSQVPLRWPHANSREYKAGSRNERRGAIEEGEGGGSCYNPYLRTISLADPNAHTSTLL